MRPSDTPIVYGTSLGPGRDVVSLVKAAARATPRGVAVRDGGVEVTYEHLVAQVELLAGTLTTAGVRAGSVVVVDLPRSWQEIVAVLAVLRAGAAFTAIDTEAPLGRARPILEACAPAAVVGEGPRAEELAALAGCARIPVPEPGMVPPARGALPELPLPPEAAAYVAFTSGSTGRPKGVVVPHRAVTRLAAGAAMQYVDAGPGRTFLRLAPLAFDASTFELFVPLAAGATIEVFPPGPVAPLELGSFLMQHRIRVAWLTAGLFRLVADEAPAAFDGLDHLLTGGDVVPAEQVRAVLARRGGALTVTNGYGPTENTTFTTTHSVRYAEAVQDPVPIGRPVPGTGVVVVDEWLNPVDRGEVGELLVTGAGLATEYLGDPAMTARAFIDHPQLGSRCYRTGDLVRWDGTELVFVGRVDRQVKIRGHRVEVAEIESVVRSVDAVRDVAVVLSTAGRHSSLIAVVVADPLVDLRGVRTVLRDRLPAYMVPSEIRLVDALPLTANGKVDLDELLRVETPAEPEAPGVSADASSSSEDLIAFVTAQWVHVLGHNDFGPDEGFFEVGGDSLAAAELHTRMSDALPGYEIRVLDIFVHPTVRTFAEHLASLDVGLTSR